ncbi:MAG TPA: cupin domain-containing protein [Candidatus Cloacimonadota bacterium]|nr:cupin domain-containing protein [Candidatus Cloacimonadota bacterium]HPT71306.1 cupin domain-containing protein [Candidatus Cloacimonadota bacterium]
MISRNWKDSSPKRDMSGVKAIEMYNHEEGQIMHLSIEPGSELKTHVTPVNVAMYVVEGEPTIFIGEEQQSYPAGTMVESPKDVPHAIRNDTKEIVRMLIMKLPRPQIK